MSEIFDNNALCQLIIDSMASAILILDDQLRVLYLNQPAESLLETSLHRVADLSIHSLIMEDSESIKVFKMALKTSAPYTKREATIQIPGNGKHTVDYTVTPMKSDTQDDLLLMEIQDIDRLLRISKEEALVSTHIATKALIRGVAHEVKNPLGGIRGAAQLLQKELSDPELTDYTSVIIDETDRLRNLVDSMLGPRKLPERSSVNVHEVTERVKSVIEAEKGEQIRLVRNYDPGLPEMKADKDQLIQALLNIVRNAAQALLENPTTNEPCITIETRPVRRVTIGSMQHRLALRINVIDNGPGIPADIIESLFYPMVSGRAAGTGLGLSIAQSIVQQHGGIIECESEPGNTRFSIIIPLEKQ